jgi:hypothetical protein
MSRWDEPNYEDVRWDHGAAAEVIGALRRTAAEVEQAVAEGEHLASAALKLWLGSHAIEFALRRGTLSTQGRDLAADCRAAAAAVAAADERARAEQARREREREEWERRERARDRERARNHA